MTNKEDIVIYRGVAMHLNKHEKGQMHIVIKQIKTIYLKAWS